MITITIPLKGTEVFNMIDTRGYVSIKNDVLHYYHKFFFKEDFIRWVTTEKIVLCWGDSLNTFLSPSRLKTPFKATAKKITS